MTARILTTSPGTLTTLGYLEMDALPRLEAFLARPRTYLIDIRLTPYTPWQPEWSRPALQARYGRQYAHLRGLGCVPSPDRRQPIHLLDPEPHLRHLAEQLTRGYSYLLLCACTHYERCHRKLVYERVLLLLGEQQHAQGTAGGVTAVSLWE